MGRLFESPRRLALLGALVASGCSSSQPNSSTSSVVIVAAGDIACDPNTRRLSQPRDPKSCRQRATAKVGAGDSAARGLGPGGHPVCARHFKQVAASDTPTWGRFKNITHPVLGNHEGGEGGTNSQYFAYFGAQAGSPRKGYYSFNIGQWHVVALNSNCGPYSFNGSTKDCVAGSAQERWLKADLASHRVACTIAFFHVPRFTSGRLHRSDAASDHALTALWTDLYAAGVDVVLNGHTHSYERFAPLAPNGTVDQRKGIREFVVGTGGDNLQRFGAPVQGSEVRSNKSFGVLKLTLHSRSYDWRFVNDGSGQPPNTDHGSSSCH